MIHRRYIFRMGSIFVTFFFFDLPLYAVNSKKTGPSSKKSLPNDLKESSSELKDSSSSTFHKSLGAGFYSVYLPQLTAEAMVGWKQLLFGLDVGYTQIPLSDFTGTSTYVGVDARYLLKDGKPFFIGGAIGQRQLVISTQADISNSQSGASQTTSVVWTRTINQMLIQPRAGWIWPLGKSDVFRGSQLSLAIGLMVPMSTSAQISGNPDSVSGLSDDDYNAVKDGKLKDVTSKTNTILPSLEIKYFYFFGK
jgi:hypothetical protein